MPTYPTLTVQALQKGPQAFQLADQAIVIWLGQDGQAGAVEDRCAHLNAPLSQGEVYLNHLSCPFHGWQFSRTGQIAWRPPGPSPMQRSCLRSFACEVREGVVWVEI